MIFIYQILNAILCIWMAHRDEKIIADQKSPNHFLNGTIHIAVSLLALYLYDYKIAIAVLLECRIVFDMALNLYRKFNPFRVSPKPVSKIDRFEKWVFGNDGLTPKVIYLAACVALNVYYIINL